MKSPDTTGPPGLSTREEPICSVLVFPLGTHHFTDAGTQIDSARTRVEAGDSPLRGKEFGREEFDEFASSQPDFLGQRTKGISRLHIKVVFVLRIQIIKESFL